MKLIFVHGVRLLPVPRIKLTLPEIRLTDLEGSIREGYILPVAAILRWRIARDALCAAVLYLR